MNMEWIAEKGTSLLAFIIAAGLIGIAALDAQYRYLYICVAIIFFVYGYRRLKKRDTPFQRREREMRRKNM